MGSLRPPVDIRRAHLCKNVNKTQKLNDIALRGGNVKAAGNVHANWMNKRYREVEILLSIDEGSFNFVIEFVRMC